MKYLFVALLLLCFSYSNAQENQKYINVNGTSELIRKADQVDFVINIITVNESLDLSKKNNDKNLNELFTILKSAGLNTEDLDVSPIKLGKNYEFKEGYTQQRQNGYYTEVTVAFVLKDLSKYYDLSNKLSQSNSFEIASSEYSLSDYEIQHKASYEQALTAAREKAEYMAKTLGLKLGEVLEIDENNMMPGYTAPFANKMSEDVSQITNVSGKVTLRRTIRVKFAIIK